jgi:glycosyltransferase involved in cell wall biosynthesis
MENLKFELIIAYYKRPKIVRNALDSILKLKYDNWHLTFVDDSGDDDFKDTFLNYGFDKDKITYVPIMMSDEEKIKNGGSMFGKYVNDAIIQSDCDIVILICDDDAMDSEYLNNLNDFYNNNPDDVWGYSHVKLFNPNVEHYSEADNKSYVYDWSDKFVNLNINTIPIHPFHRLDSSQVTFRKSAMVNGNVWYDYPRTANLDADIFMKMFNKYGACKFTECYGQYKGWFVDQLGARQRSGRGDFVK